ncbi:tannase/feruloyl esterase family alpha/beta hydrolase [Azohydromonas australica]|uniref:tannase/feruloyl esterase family alpha/beta hydrolase n=1 Tax=Azohydromonas australica TaxID=364039 RepID=UPI00146B0FAC|nr:tannase/feruloyl esterase family alpha/beta hydrolase [Azohydromonas australica]
MISLLSGPARRPRSLLAVVFASALWLLHPLAQAMSGSVTLPVMSCADLMKVDFSRLEDAPTKINSALETPAGNGIPTAQCVVSGYVAPELQFNVRLPMDNWTGRLVMQGCGGYCGNLISLPVSYSPSAATNCPRILSGELAVAGHNGGHVGQMNPNRFLASISDGMWALNNPDGLIDFYYRSNHKATVAVKAIMRAFYGRPVQFSYFDGCSSGGRAGLHVAQRYPEDYEGILAGAPTIDNTATNTFSHSWNVRVNRAPNGTSILTSDKIPALAKAVLAACADESGMIQDPRACRFNANSLICNGADNASCLTPAQARAANRIHQGPVDENGRLLAPGGMPYGSELAWAGSIALAPGVVYSQDTSSEFAFSYDFPNYMARFHETGITNANIRFTSQEFRYLDALHGINDPTNPDLTAFAARGGKLIMWQGWADPGTSPFGTLNYFNAVRNYMGWDAASHFMTLYMLPGVYHCAGGPVAATLDMLTPLMNWVEDQTAPAAQVISYRTTGDATSPVTRTRKVFPYPSTSVYNGRGNVNQASSYVQGPPTPGVSDVLHWAGLFHYTPNQQLWCKTEGRARSASVQCVPLADFTRDQERQRSERERARASGGDS